MFGERRASSGVDLCDALGAVLLPCLAALIGGYYFFSSARSLDFQWFDASKHALNGVFVHDAIMALPFKDASGWAEKYFTQYPGLTFGLYPPLVHLEFAVAALVLGVSHHTFQLVIALHAAALFVALQVLLRHAAKNSLALMIAFTAMLMPEFLYWGRQTMLEIPLLSFMTAAAVFAVKYSLSGRAGHLAAFVVLLLCAMYTKQQSVLLIPAVAVLWYRRKRFQKSAVIHLLAAGLATAIALVPYAVLQYKFGSFNAVVLQGTGSTGEWPDRYSLEALTFYFRQWPNGLGTPALALCVVGLFGFFPKAVVEGDHPAELQRVDARDLLFFFVTWLAVGWAVMTYITGKEARHGVSLLLPIVGIASIGVAGLRADVQRLFVPLVAVSAAFNAWTAPTPYYSGHSAAADMAVTRTPRGGRVGILMQREGNFIVSVRVNHHDKSITTIRLEKEFFDYYMARAFGLSENSSNPSAEQITQRLVALGVSTVVIQQGMWDDLPTIKAIQAALLSPSFTKVASFQQKDERSTELPKLDVYAITVPLPKNPLPVSIKSRVAGRTFGSQ